MIGYMYCCQVQAYVKYCDPAFSLQNSQYSAMSDINIPVTQGMTRLILIPGDCNPLFPASR